MGGRHLQNLGESAMKVVRSLRARPDGQLPIRVLCGDGGMLLDGKMRAALVEKSVLKDFVGFGERFLAVAEFRPAALVNFPSSPFLLKRRSGVAEGFLGIGDVAQNL